MLLKQTYRQYGSDLYDKNNFVNKGHTDGTLGNGRTDVDIGDGTLSRLLIKVCLDLVTIRFRVQSKTNVNLNPLINDSYNPL